MPKSDLGTKRVCPVTGRKFYDLNKDPVISPYTGEIVPIAPIPLTRAGRDAAAAAARAAATREVEVPETPDAEFVSLEDADAEASGGKKAAVGDEDIDGDDDETAEDDTTLIEDSEDSDDDVADIIGDGRENEEET